MTMHMPSFTRSMSMPWFIDGESTLHRVCRDVCDKFGVSRSDLMGQSREARFARARHEAFLRLIEAGWSTARIGRAFRRDHTTVIYGARRARQRIEREAQA